MRQLIGQNKISLAGNRKALASLQEIQKHLKIIEEIYADYLESQRGRGDGSREKIITLVSEPIVLQKKLLDKLFEKEIKSKSFDFLAIQASILNESITRMDRNIKRYEESLIDDPRRVDYLTNAKIEESFIEQYSHHLLKESIKHLPKNAREKDR